MNQQRGDDYSQPPEPVASPRAFVIGSGAVFQSVGGLFVFMACVVWLISAWTVPKAAAPQSQWNGFFHEEHLPSALMTIALLLTFVGGLGLLAVGLGLQGERPGSGRVAMAASGLLATCYLIVSVAYVVALGRVISALLVFALAGMAAVLFLLAGHSAGILRKFPPPPDQNVATPEILEEFRQKRLDRLKHYEP